MCTVCSQKTLSTTTTVSNWKREQRAREGGEKNTKQKVKWIDVECVCWWRNHKTEDNKVWMKDTTEEAEDTKVETKKKTIQKIMINKWKQ